MKDRNTVCTWDYLMFSNRIIYISVVLTLESLTLCKASTLAENPTDIFISHASVRMMASFIGKEEQYSSLIGAIVSIYKDDGILGFFHGIIPKLLGDLTCVAVTGALAYYVNKYFVKTKDLRYYTVPLLTFLTSTLTYPLVVVSTCMAVAGCSLQAGNPPAMSKYPSWHTCWRDLVINKQHKRGASLIFRYYIAPIAAMQ